MEAIYKKQFTIQGIDVDFRQQLKLSSFFTYLQDMATEHVAKLGAGRNVIQSVYGVVWVLIRARADVLRYPKIGENITLETWPNNPGKLEFERNFLMYDSKNNIIARAFTSWVLIDFNTRRLKRSSLIKPDFPESGRENAIDCQLGKLESKGDLSIQYKKTVGYSDIDVNEHLNNAKYVDYIMDCFSLEQHKKYIVNSIEIDYVHEAMPGETIVLKSDLTNVEQNVIYIEGINEETGKTSFKSQIKITRSPLI